MRIPVLLFLAATVLLVTSAPSRCSSDRAARYPDIAVFDPGAAGDAGQVGIDVSEGAGALGCQALCGGQIEDRAFKFTRIFVTEPNEDTAPQAGALVDILNDLWSRDLASNVLNLVFEVGEVDYVAGAASVLVGPAWYRRTPEAVAANPSPRLDEVPDEDIEAICLLTQADGTPMTGDFSAALDDTCAFNIDGAGNDPDGEGVFLAFHTGPTTDPVICAPEQGQTPGLSANTIPLMIHVARGRFADDCGAIVDGFMSGCIALEHANRICMCIDQEYKCEPQPAAVGGYCAQLCGRHFLNFGDLVTDVAGIPETCTVMGKQGIRIAAEFEAVVLPAERYDPRRSIDCLVD